MKPKARHEAAPASPVRVEFRVQFSTGPKGRRRIGGEGGFAPTAAPMVPSAIIKGSTAAERPPHPAPSDVPKITQLLVVAYWWERLIAEGKVKDYAEIAKLTGLSRARVTQIVNLTLLAPDIQAQILAGQGPAANHSTVHVRRIRTVTSFQVWEEQRKCFPLALGPRTGILRVGSRPYDAARAPLVNKRRRSTKTGGEVPNL